MPAATWATPPRVTSRDACPLVTAADFGGIVARIESVDGLAAYELRRSEGEPERVILVPERRLPAAHIRQIDDALERDGVLHLWISKRNHWSSDLSGLAWLPIVAAPGRTPGHIANGIAVNGIVISLAQAAHQFCRGSHMFNPEVVAARRLAERLEH